MFRSVASRLFLSYLAVVAVGLVAAAITIAGLLVRYENDTLRVRLEELSAPLLVQVQNGVRDGKQPREIIEGLAEQARSADARLLIQQALRPAATGALGPALAVVARPRAAFADAVRILLPSLLVAGLVAAGFALIVA